MTLALATSATIQNPPGVEDHLARGRDAIAAKEREITEAQARCATLAAKDAELVVAINENRRLAAIPEPQAADFASLEPWHAALRKWRADRTSLDQVFVPLERDRGRLANESIPAAKAKVDALRHELAWLELDAAKDEHLVAQRQMELHASRVMRLQAALAALSNH